ncbi:MAG TPA: ACP S-malonyltransferase [Rectinemataceae bacterium]|nr:ACP S-malonyltransferase [Rectinemataceae bacterium]
MKTCFLFPGQGAQKIGMGKDFYETSKAVRELFELASDASKIDLSKLIFEGTEDELKQTRNTQIAMAVVEAATALSAREHAIHPEACAGFSVGEWPALAEAGVVGLADMFRLVAERGRLMDEAGNRSGGSTMSAILMLAPEGIEKVIAEAGLKQVWVANYNSPSQCVISGTEADVAAAETACKAAGAKRAIRLKVSGAFHSPIMAWARDGFAELVSDVVFSDPKIAVFSNVTGRRIESGAEAKKLCVEQVVSPVRWIAEEEAIAAAGFDQCFETGPGTVLSGLWKAVYPDIPCAPLGSLAEIATISL